MRLSDQRKGYVAAPWGEDVAMLPAREHWSYRVSAGRRMRRATRNVARAVRRAIERTVLEGL